MPNETPLSPLLESDFVTPVTRAVLTARFNRPAVESPRFFTADEFATLRAAVGRLVPRDPSAGVIDVAGAIDTRLADAAAAGHLSNGFGDGWRYADAPPDGEAHRLGLAGLEEAAQHRHGAGFVEIPSEAQDAILADAKATALKGGAWDRVPAGRFFEDLLAESAELYYCHPAAQREMDYLGFADALGWSKIELNEPVAQEAVLHSEHQTMIPK